MPILEEGKLPPSWHVMPLATLSNISLNYLLLITEHSLVKERIYATIRMHLFSIEWPEKGKPLCETTTVWKGLCWRIFCNKVKAECFSLHHFLHHSHTLRDITFMTKFCPRSCWQRSNFFFILFVPLTFCLHIFNDRRLSGCLLRLFSL